MTKKKVAVFDVESVGLYGEGFAFGMVLYDHKGDKIEEFFYACNPDQADGFPEGRDWLRVHLPEMDFNCDRVPMVRHHFSKIYEKLEKDTYFMAECPYPVETTFLAQAGVSPYPLFDVSSILFARYGQFVETLPRFYDEYPKHNPLCDARQSGRLMWDAMKSMIVTGKCSQTQGAGCLN